MHILKIARELGITTQELKQEISKVNFGINVDDKDVPDHLAAGILRVLGAKFKGTKRTQAVDMSTISGKVTPSNDSNHKPTKPIVTTHFEDDSPDTEEISPKRKSIRERRLEEERIKKENELIEIEKKEVDANKTKEVEDNGNIQQKLEEEFKMFNKKTKKFKKENQSNHRDSIVREGIVSITRKIEIDPNDVENDKKKLKKRLHTDDDSKHKAAKKIKFKELTQEEIDQMSEEEQIQYFADHEEQKRVNDELFKEQQSKKKKVIKAYTNQEQIKKKEGIILIPDVITVKEFAEKIGVSVMKIITTLMKNGMMVTINQSIDFDTASLISVDLGVEVKRDSSSASAEDLIEGDILKLIKDDKENLEKRPPVVVVMGHVDHGKTSILDFYRSSDVVAKESGGITQHIGAYQVEKNGRLITFLDTPGHEAFTSMRARGAKVTDIAILVVAADDGVQPQTIEACNHANDAGIPIVVAMNKIDKPGIDPERIKSQLSEIGVVCEDWGGDVPFVPVSAKQGTGMNDLLDTVLLVSDVDQQYANPNRNAIATVIESHLDKSFGPVATILVNTGTLKLKDIFIAGKTMGRIKTMFSATGKVLKKILPSGTARISGFEIVPNVGDILQVVNTEKEAKEKTSKIKNIYEHSRKKGLGIEEIQRRIATGKMNLLKIILKVDSVGSLEAVSETLSKIKNDEVGIKIIHSGVGNATDSDVLMAAASGALIIGFHVSVSPQTKRLADKEGVDIQCFTVIYDILNTVRSILTGMLTSEEIEVEAGDVKILQIFYTKKKMMIVGGKVEKGYIKKGAKVIAFRDGLEVGKSKLTNLKFFKDDAKEVLEGNECGMQFAGKLELQVGDLLKVFVAEKVIKSIA